jgi:hypothetical protein
MIRKRCLLIAVVLGILLPGSFAQDFDAEVFRAVSELSDMSRAITVGIGPISFGSTGSVSSLSGFLKEQIAFSAVKNSDKYRVVSGSEVDSFINATNFIQTRSIDPLGQSAGSAAPIQGLIEGQFFQVGDDVEVTLTLTAVSGNVRIGTSRFIVPAEELRRRSLSVLPPKENRVIEQAEFEEKQEILEPFAGTDNPFTIQVWSNKADNLFYAGDEMRINLYSDRSCYFTVFHVDVYGMRQRIYPNDYDTDNYLAAGTRRSIPEQSSFIMEAPYGEEYILVIASDTRFKNEPAEQKAVKITRSIDGSRDITLVYDEGVGKGAKPLEAEARYGYTILSGK